MTIGCVGRFQVKIMIEFRKIQNMTKFQKNIQKFTQKSKKICRKSKNNEIHVFQYQVLFKCQISTAYRTDIHIHVIIYS